MTTATNMHFDIIGADEADHTVLVRYTTDRIGPSMLSPQLEEDGSIKMKVFDDGVERPASIRTDVNVGIPREIPLDKTDPAFIAFVTAQGPRAWFQLLEDKMDGEIGGVTDLIGGVSSFEQQVVRELQFRLDAFARTKGYDDIKSAASYAGDEDPEFDSDGRYAKKMKSRFWRKSYQIMGDVVAGHRPVPTLADILAEMPPLAWPDVAAQ